MNIMKAFIIDRYSKKTPMRFGEMPAPELRDDDVLIEVHAAGLNPLPGLRGSGQCEGQSRRQDQMKRGRRARKGHCCDWRAGPATACLLLSSRATPAVLQRIVVP